jgi:hypothetical protein
MSRFIEVLRWFELMCFNAKQSSAAIVVVWQSTNQAAAGNWLSVRLSTGCFAAGIAAGTGIGLLRGGHYRGSKAAFA